MKQIMAGVVLLGFLASCGNANKKKTGYDPFANLTHEVDKLREQADTAVEAVPAPPETPVPTRADESFDDFIYNFASDDALQRQRVKFPLPYYEGDLKRDIGREEWKHDSLFIQQPYYTLLFDKEADMDVVPDSTLTSVQVEWIYVKRRMVKRYYFERVRGAWILEAINRRAIEADDNEDFVEFFQRFASDSLFQRQRVRDPLEFVTIDPDDEFSVLNATINVDQWFAFHPTLPTDSLSNINYGQANDDHSRAKILALKGIGNGFSNILHFRLHAGKWELYKFEDTSV
ncbi:MAG: DUF4348 domain-containing protein [Mediterranea sp.]|jgi:hypothetical protein|nr:DUF4348 domain-containing protein [Mediterranea sp.]